MRGYFSGTPTIGLNLTLLFTATVTAVIAQGPLRMHKHTVNQAVGVIAMPLPAPDGTPQLAAGVAGPVQRLEEAETRIVAAMRAGIERFLGKKGEHRAA